MIGACDDKAIQQNLEENKIEYAFSSAKKKVVCSFSPEQWQ